VQLAEELGLTVEAKEMTELSVDAMVKGIGRKATDDELVAYLNKGIVDEPIE